MSGGSLSIAQVSPHPWERRHEINEFVRRTSEELTRRGHRVLIVAPSDSRKAIRESRRLIREAESNPGAVMRGENPRVLAVGQSIPLPSGPRRRPAPLPLDVSRALERLLGAVFFGRIDERLASNEATGELLQRFFPGQYQLIRPGADVAEPALDPPPAGRIRI